jgi:hypothetical protein
MDVAMLINLDSTLCSFDECRRCFRQPKETGQWNHATINEM